MLDEQSRQGVEYFVSPQGNDAWSGTMARPHRDGTDGPFRTLARAVEALYPGDICTIRQGTYRETLHPIRSGTPDQPIVFRNYRQEKVTISGAEPVTGWEHYRDSIYRASMDWDLANQNQVFVNGNMVFEASWPSNSGGVLSPTRSVVSIGQSREGRAEITDPQLPTDVDEEFWQGAYLFCGGGDVWVYWTVDIVGYDPGRQTLVLDQEQLENLHPSWRDEWYHPRKGNRYILMGAKGMLDSEGEWWYDCDAGQLYLWAPGGVNPEQLQVEARRYNNRIDLSGLSHIQIIGLDLFSAGLMTDTNTHHVLLQNMTAKYIGHSYRRGVDNVAGIRLDGSDNEINSCEFAYSSGGILIVSGTGHKVVNSHIHHGNYAAGWGGLARISGRRHLISHNTFQDSGRDMLGLNGISESLIQYNVLSGSGWLAFDLGMTYGHTTDFRNTVIRYNWVFDNHAGVHPMGIYFDPVSRNVIVHDNVVWNVGGTPLRVNNPSHFVLFFNNTAYQSGQTGTFDWANRDDLYGTMYLNNILNHAPSLPPEAIVAYNCISQDPGFVNPANKDFQLCSDSPAIDGGIVIGGVTGEYTGRAPDIGAYQLGVEPWIPGHDFANPPNPVFERPQIEFMNLVDNACFDTGDVEGWKIVGDGEVGVSPGSGWGDTPKQPTGTGRYELHLGPGAGGTEQQITRLEPGTRYEASAWLRVADSQARICLSIRDEQGETLAVATSQSNEWERLIVAFQTRPDQTFVVFSVVKEGPGEASAYGANLGMQKVFVR